MKTRTKWPFVDPLMTESVGKTYFKLCVVSEFSRFFALAHLLFKYGNFSAVSGATVQAARPGEARAAATSCQGRAARCAVQVIPHTRAKYGAKVAR